MCLRELDFLYGKFSTKEFPLKFFYSRWSVACGLSDVSLLSEWRAEDNSHEFRDCVYAVSLWREVVATFFMYDFHSG